MKNIIKIKLHSFGLHAACSLGAGKGKPFRGDYYKTPLSVEGGGTRSSCGCKEFAWDHFSCWAEAIRVYFGC